MNRSLLIRVMLATLLFRQEAFAEAGDVYNFYFQKAPGPTTVIQGGGKPENNVQVRETPNGVEVIQPTKPAEPASTLKTAPLAEPKKEEEPDYKKWSVRFGSEVKTMDIAPDYWNGPNNTASAGGTTVGGTYSFNKYLAVDASVLFAKTMAVSNSYTRNRTDAVIPYFGLELTPIRLVLFNYDLMDFAIIAGVTSKGLGSPTEASHYTGVRFTLNISSNFAVQAVGRFTPESEAGEGGAHFAWKF